MGRRARVVATLVASGFGLRYIVERAGDERNIGRLAAHEGCSVAEARELYAAARREGYGAAHREVFGSEARIGSRPSRPAR